MPPILYINNHYCTSLHDLRSIFEGDLLEVCSEDILAACRDGLLFDWLMERDEECKVIAGRLKELDIANLGNRDLLQKLGELFTSNSVPRVPRSFEYEFSDFAELVECSWSLSDGQDDRHVIKNDVIGLPDNVQRRTEGNVVLEYKFKILNPEREVLPLTLTLKDSHGDVLLEETKRLGLAVDKNSLQTVEFAVDCELIRKTEQVQLAFEGKTLRLLTVFFGLKAIYGNKQVGDRFEFGHYPQGANGEIGPITWRVLRRDSDSLLVISERRLDSKSYNEQYCSTCWADCTLRRWLNDEFINKAFNEQEQSLIKTSKLTNNAGPSTEDRVFLLSVDEAKSLFSGDCDRCTVTEKSYYPITWWWLRSRGFIGNRAASVDGNGAIHDDGNRVIRQGSGSVRPAFRIAI